MALSKDPIKRDSQLVRFKATKAGMTNAQYKDWLQDNYGVLSASLLSDAQRRNAHGKLNRLLDAGKPDAGWREPQIDKLRAMWLALADAGAVRSRDEKAMEAWCKRQHRGMSALRFARNDQLQSLIEALKKWALRVGADIT